MIKKSSNDNLNEFKGYINGYRDDVAYTCKALNKAGNGTFYLDDIVEVYRHKIFDYSDKLEDKGIDYFNPDYYSRYIMKIYFDILMVNGITDLTWLMNNINKVGYVSKFIPFVSKVTFGKVADRYNKVCSNIKNFQFKDNKDVIYHFFCNKLLFEGFVPGSIIRFWKDVKKELEVLGCVFTQEELDLINEEILNREFEAVDRYHELGEDSMIVFREKCYELGLNLKCNEEFLNIEDEEIKKTLK